MGRGDRGAPRDRNRKAIPKPLHRLIHLPNEIWSWEFRGSDILIRTPDNETTHTVLHTEISGYSWNALERAEWKHTGERPISEGGYQVTPGVIKTWIKEHYK
jgi:hypothetical protein